MVPNHRHQIALRGLYGRWTIGESPSKKWWPTTIAKLKLIKVIIILSTIVNWIHFAPSKDSRNHHMAMDQYLLIPFLGGWTSIYQLFWCSPGVQGFDTLPHRSSSGHRFLSQRILRWIHGIRRCRLPWGEWLLKCWSNINPKMVYESQYISFLMSTSDL